MSDDFRDDKGRFTDGNPGRPKGSRNRLSEAFLRVLADDFEDNGVDAIERLRADNPGQYANVIAKLMPKLMELSGPEGGPIEHEHEGIRFWDAKSALEGRTRDPLVEGDD